MGRGRGGGAGAARGRRGGARGRRGGVGAPTSVPVPEGFHQPLGDRAGAVELGAVRLELLKVRFHLGVDPVLDLLLSRAPRRLRAQLSLELHDSAPEGPRVVRLGLGDGLSHGVAEGIEIDRGDLLRHWGRLPMLRCPRGVEGLPHPDPDALEDVEDRAPEPGLALGERRQVLEELGFMPRGVLLPDPLEERLPVLGRGDRVADQELDLREDVLVNGRRPLVDQGNTDPRVPTHPDEVLDGADHPGRVSHDPLGNELVRLVDREKEGGPVFGLSLPMV